VLDNGHYRLKIAMYIYFTVSRVCYINVLVSK